MLPSLVFVEHITLVTFGVPFKVTMEVLDFI